MLSEIIGLNTSSSNKRYVCTFKALEAVEAGLWYMLPHLGLSGPIELESGT